MEAIHQIAGFNWFSERKTLNSAYRNVLEALSHHIAYVKNKASAILGDTSLLFEKAKQELSKRWDSRIALKFFIAVPKDWLNTPRKALLLTTKFVADFFDLPEENVFAFFHSNAQNPHVHFVIFPRLKNGRKLDINRKKLSEFHKAWDELLQSMGYSIKRFRDSELEIETLPTFLFKKDEELRELYAEFSQLRNEIKQHLEELKDELAQYETFTDEEINRFLNREHSVFGRLKSLFARDDFESFKDKQRHLIKVQLEALGFNQDDKIAVVLSGEGKKPLQRIIKVSKLFDEAFLKFLRRKNVEGYNIYISLNKLKPDAKSRKKSEFNEKQKLIYLDIDGDKLGADGFKLLSRILKEENLPAPTLVLQTSKRNLQVVWKLDEERSFNELELIMRKLSEKYGLDYTQDISRVFRLAGFRNRKQGKNFLVDIVEGSTLKPVAFDSFSKYSKGASLVRKLNYRSIAGSFKRLKVYEYASSLDVYLETLKKLLPDLKLNYVENLLSDYKYERRNFKSFSEFELSLTHALRKDLALKVEPSKRYHFLKLIFQKLLEEIRPSKLERNKKYVELTVSKACLPIRKLEQIAEEFEHKLEKNSKAKEAVYKALTRFIKSKTSKEPKSLKEAMVWYMELKFLEGGDGVGELDYLIDEAFFIANKKSSSNERRDQHLDNYAGRDFDFDNRGPSL